MLPADFWLMCEGYSKYHTKEIEAIRDIVFSAHRFSASATAMSKEASRKIGRHKFPWEKSEAANGKPELMNNKTIERIINAIGTKDDG